MSALSTTNGKSNCCTGTIGSNTGSSKFTTSDAGEPEEEEGGGEEENQSSSSSLMEVVRRRTYLDPGQTPKMVPTAKLVSMMDEPSRGSKATEKPSPPIGSSVGVSSEEAVATTPESFKFSKRTLLAKISIANCSSPNSLKQAILSHEAVRIL